MVLLVICFKSFYLNQDLDFIFSSFACYFLDRYLFYWILILFNTNLIIIIVWCFEGIAPKNFDFINNRKNHFCIYLNYLILICLFYLICVISSLELYICLEIHINMNYTQLYLYLYNPESNTQNSYCFHEKKPNFKYLK